MMLLSYNGSPVDPHVELVALADNAWRLSDDRIPEADARRILGYVEQRNGDVEIIWMRPRPGECEYFSCLAEALAAASARLSLEGDEAWDGKESTEKVWH
jgi:hypothetical protein